MPAWSYPDRGFRMFEDEWVKMFTVAGAGATFFGMALDLLTSASTITAFSIAAVSGLLMVAAYTDMLVGKVPLEISHTTLWTGFFLGLGALTANSFNPEDFQRYYNTIPLLFGGNEWLWIGGGIAVGLIFFLAWLRVKSLLSLVLILISMMGFWIAATAGLSLAAVGLSQWLGHDEVWRNIFVYGIPSMLIVVFFAVAFDLGAGNYMGGADSQSMYAAGWGFAGVVGGVVIGAGVFVAAFLQLGLHLLRKPLGLPGKEKAIKRSAGMKQLTKGWYAVTGRKGKELPETRIAMALPFLPMLNLSVVGATVIAIALG